MSFPKNLKYETFTVLLFDGSKPLKKMESIILNEESIIGESFIFLLIGHVNWFGQI